MPYAPLRDALIADPDVQCTVYHVSAGGDPRRVLTRETAHLGAAFPKTAAELLAYDALVLSNVPGTALNEEILGWVEEWIGKRGGGLLMAGGPRAFGSGGWNGTAIERMLPVEFLNTPDWDGSPSTPEPTGADLHPVWRLFEDERATRRRAAKPAGVGGAQQLGAGEAAVGHGSGHSESRHWRAFATARGGRVRSRADDGAGDSAFGGTLAAVRTAVGRSRG